MNKDLYDKLKLDSIGVDCYYQSLTTSINYLDMGFLALLYTPYIFIYNFDNFIELHTEGPPESYLSDSNKLIFKNRPVTWLEVMYYNFFEENMKFIDLQRYMMEVYLNEVNEVSLKNIKSNYLDKDLPIMVAVYAQKLKKEYLEIGGNVALGDNSPHLINLVDLDINKAVCTIVDTFFKIKGEIPIKSFINSLMYKNNTCKLMSFDCELKGLKIDFFELLKENLKTSTSPYVIINGSKHENNIKPIENLIRDLPEIINVFQNKYGVYSNQFLSFSFKYQRRLIRSCGYLYKNLYDKYEIKPLDMIGELSKISGDLWFNFDYVFDKSYLKNEMPVNQIENLTIILEKISENNKKVIENMNNLYIYLQ